MRRILLFVFTIAVGLVLSGGVVIAYWRAGQLAARKQEKVTVKNHRRQPVVGRIQNSAVTLPKRLTPEELRKLESDLGSNVRKTIDKLTIGELPPQPTDCWRIDFTDYYACIDIWIEDSSPGPGE